MLSISALTELVNDEQRKAQDEILKYRQLYYGMSLHIDGACPMWTSLRDSRLGWIPGNFIVHQPLMGWYGLPYHEIFDLVLFARHPKEPEVTRQWRFSQYRPFTKDGFLRAITMVTGAIFQDSSYSITLSDRRDNEYIWGNNFQDSTLPGYIAKQFNSIASDPNALFLVIPKESADQTTTDEIEPDIWFLYNKDILYRTEDEIVFKKHHKDPYVWAVNKFGYFRWLKNEATKKWELVDPLGYYPHMLGYIPAFEAGGIWNGQGFYDSWFVSAKAVADEFVSVKSAEQMVAKEASHPWIIEASEKCPECQNGRVNYCYACHRTGDGCTCEEEDRDWSQRNCSVCGGSGQVSHNPGERIIAPPEQMKDVLVQVVNPSVDINKLHAENVKEGELKILKALHLNYIDQAQAAIAKDRDMQTRYQYVLGISNDIFDRLIPKLIKAITALRNITVSNGVIVPTSTDFEISKPTQFDIKTGFDLLEQMEMAKKADIPAWQRGVLLEESTDKMFNGNQYLKRKTALINQMDQLANIPISDISVMLLNGFVTQRDAQFHTVLPIIFDELNRDRGADWLCEAKFEDIKAEVDAIFKIKFPPLPTVQEPDAEEKVIV